VVEMKSTEVTGGTLSAIMPLHTSNLLFLIGGGRSPRYPPNKVILWDDIKAKEVAELEFKEKVRGLACRRGWFVVALKRRVVVFQLEQTISKYREYDTCENPRGMHQFLLPFVIIFFIDSITYLTGLVALATAPQSTLLCMPGRQTGHVRLVHLPPCPSPKPSAPSLSQRPKSTVPAPPLSQHVATLIKAHESPLSTLYVSLSGRLLATTSSRGTLVRVWDAATGKLFKEFRRGSDKADIFGVAFRPDEKELCVWSDKGTIHLFSLERSSTA
jgi:WD repeat-containing protein 45